MRWYLMAANIVRGGDLRVSDAGIDEVTRQILLPVWNAYSFFTMYANAEGYRAQARTDSDDVLDRYVLARTRTMVQRVTERMDAYDLPGGAAEIAAFIDALNNWYIRRSRDRFWNAGGADTDRAAFDTLYVVLTTLTRVAAPFLPMIAEEIHGGLTGGSSVHLADWPDPDAEGLPADDALVARMERLRDAASAALRVREDCRTAGAPAPGPGHRGRRGRGGSSAAGGPAGRRDQRQVGGAHRRSLERTPRWC